MPRRQKCNRWSECPHGKFAFQILSGGGIQKQPKICFENAMSVLSNDLILVLSSGHSDPSPIGTHRRIATTLPHTKTSEAFSFNRWAVSDPPTL